MKKCHNKTCRISNNMKNLAISQISAGPCCDIGTETET